MAAGSAGEGAGSNTELRWTFSSTRESRSDPPGRRRHNPMPPPLPGESGVGSPEAELTGSGREDETAVGPRPKKHKRGRRAPQSSHDHRKANRREDRGVVGAPLEWG